MRLIDADELIKTIDGNPFTTDSVKSYIHVSVAKMPTIEPERKKGKWSYDMNGYYKCSECGISTSIPDNGSSFVDDCESYHFCR